MEVGLNKPNTSELNNADLNIINQNILCLIENLANFEKHIKRMDFDVCVIKKTIKKERRKSNETN